MPVCLESQATLTVLHAPSPSPPVPWSSDLLEEAMRAALCRECRMDVSGDVEHHHHCESQQPPPV